MLDPQAKRFLDMLAVQSGSAANLPIGARRAAFANLMRFCAPGAELAAIETIEAGRALRLYRPQKAQRTALVYLHGGGLVAGSLDTHDSLCRSLAAASRCRLFAVDYRLAPEHPFPAARDDALAALAWVFEKAAAFGVDRVGIGGDSAGATLAAVTAAHWGAQCAPPLAFQFLLCPIVDFAGERPSRKAFASPILDQAALDHDIALYTNGMTPAADPAISPLRAASFAGLPPTLLHTAGCDPLRDEGMAYATRLCAAGIEVQHTCHAGLPHLFYALSAAIPAAKQALAKIGAELGDWPATRTAHL